ncbi:SDR family oxidoreductase [Pinisolibacter sp.]|uniref:SDR family oxidoreductase n=1 Tax=Pinisolibacter sp. TaxID=2172024 RepID=UPI002FDDE75B
MKFEDRTLLVTGGASGIGRGLAEALHARGARVIIAGRRADLLAEVTAVNPGMASMVLDVTSAEAIADFAARLVAAHPDLDGVVNNAGIMRREDVTTPAHLADAEATVVTNLLGPIRLTAHLLPHLTSRPRATVINVTSGLAFVPLAATPTYSATKAALHSYSESLRHQLAGTSVEVVELAPPYVQTTLLGDFQASDPNAMPLADFITEVMGILSAEPTPPEVIVERCRTLRHAAERGAYAAVFAGVNGQHL